MYIDFSVYVEIRKYQRGSQILGRCPLHNDRNPSFWGDEKSGMWKCYAGCGEGSLEVLEILLDANGNSSVPLRVMTPVRGTQKAKASRAPAKEIEAEYIYRDGTGFPKLKVVRIKDPVKGKTFHQFHFQAGLWVSGGYPGPIAPYRYHDWKDQLGTVFLVEGEKKVESLFSLGLLSTTTPNGASAWRSEFARYFSERDVVILPDNDAAGNKYADAARNDIVKHARSLKILQLPGLDKSEDVVDWINAGGSREALVALLKNAVVIL